jgi:hypothetical protein
MRVNYSGTRKKIYLDTLREITYHLFRAWSESINDIYKIELEKNKILKEE